MKKLLVLAYILMSTTSGWAKISTVRNHSYSNCPKALSAKTAVVKAETTDKKQKAIKEGG